jgi:hypothetical protein
MGDRFVRKQQPAAVPVTSKPWLLWECRSRLRVRDRRDPRRALNISSPTYWSCASARPGRGALLVRGDQVDVLPPPGQGGPWVGESR